MSCRTNKFSATWAGAHPRLLLARALGSAASEQDCTLGLEYFHQVLFHAHKLEQHHFVSRGARNARRAEGNAHGGLHQQARARQPKHHSLELGIADPHFRYVYGGNSFERKKPDPMGVESILREFGAAPAQTMFVGDSEVDVQTARNAGTWVFAA